MINSDTPFPATHLAREDGLLGYGGCINPKWVLAAYRHGIFPWFNDGAPLWWSPEPRMVFQPEHFHVSRSLKKLIRQKCSSINPSWRLIVNHHFEDILQACAHRAEGTWINPDMKKTYRILYDQGYGFCVALVDISGDERLMGGLYGLRMGRMLFGESMFSHTPSASKIVLAGLMAWMKKNALPMLDAQVVSPHLQSLGALSLTRKDFESALKTLIDQTEIAWPESLEWGDLD